MRRVSLRAALIASLAIAGAIEIGARFLMPPRSLGDESRLDDDLWEANLAFVVVHRDGGGLRVIESWAGELRPDDTCTVIHQARSSSGYHLRAPPRPDGLVDARIVDRSAETAPHAPPISAHADAMIFLLHLNDAGASRRLPEPLHATIALGDMPPSGLESSIGFVENGIVWSQGADGERHTRGTLDEFSARAKHVIAVREAFTRATNVDPELASTARARRLAPFATSDVARARREAFDALAKLGSGAVASLAAMLDDESIVKVHPDVLRTLARTRSERAGPPIARALERDLAFWRAIASALGARWWDDAREGVRLRYWRTCACLDALRELAWTDAIATASELRALWRTLPQSKGARLIDACDALIALGGRS